MRNKLRRRTKIVATIGPASAKREIIREMINAGLDVARLNFSHGTHEDHGKVLAMIREESEKLGRYVAVFQDLCGPKVRISELEGGEVILEEGKRVILRYAAANEGARPIGNSDLLFIEAFDPVEVMRPGEPALLADGRILLSCDRVTHDQVECIVRAGGKVRSRSGISVPESELNLPCLTEKDKKDIAWAVKNDVDYIALSFVGNAADIHDARRVIESFGGAIPIIAKVERASSMDHIGAIVEVSDAVMVARGDLGLELPLERVPSAQRLVIRTSIHHGTPVITATQMLMSMVKEIRPTRAEVSDVCTAVRDGTDAVMLSDETAIGNHPVESIRVLSRIVSEAESELNYERTRPTLMGSDREKVSDAVCFAACNAADKLAASAIIACTSSGQSARLIGKYRPQQTLFGATSELKTLNRMALYWGVNPVLIRLSEDTNLEDEINQAMFAVRDQYDVKPGSRVVITAGLRAKRQGSTNVMEVRDIPRVS